MLAIDPCDRYSTEEALKDPYVRFWYKEAEVIAEKTLNQYTVEQANPNSKNNVIDWKLDEKQFTLGELKCKKR